MRGEVAPEPQPFGPLLFEFTGTVGGRESADSSEIVDANHKPVEAMNGRSLEIAARIQRDLKRMMPPGTETSVEIDYFEGSLEWVGVVVIILDWTARIADNISFIEYAQRAIRFVINRVHRLELRSFPKYRSWAIETDVRPVHLVTPSTTGLYGPGGAAFGSPSIGRPIRFPRDLRVLLYLNTLLLIVILVILASEYRYL